MSSQLHKCSTLTLRTVNELTHFAACNRCMQQVCGPGGPRRSWWSSQRLLRGCSPGSPELCCDVLFDTWPIVRFALRLARGGCGHAAAVRIPVQSTSNVVASGSMQQRE